MYCRNCGSKIAENADVCPICGSDQGLEPKGPDTQYRQQPQSDRYNIMSMIGMGISVLSLFISLWGLMGVAGVILSKIAKDECEKTGERGREFAIAGLALGAVTIAVGVISLIFSANLMDWLGDLFNPMYY